MNTVLFHFRDMNFMDLISGDVRLKQKTGQVSGTGGGLVMRAFSARQPLVPLRRLERALDARQGRAAPSRLLHPQRPRLRAEERAADRADLVPM